MRHKACLSRANSDVSMMNADCIPAKNAPHLPDYDDDEFYSLLGARGDS